MRLDFVMKLFLALIVVFFVIIAVYYSANGLAGIFGITFKIGKPGLYNGNLENLGIKNITKISITNADYSDCLSYCQTDEFEPHLFGNCVDQCSFICNQTNGCLNITSTFRIATLTGYANISFEEGNLIIDSETFNRLPEVIYITHTFFLPNGTISYPTNLTWKTKETQGVIKLGSTKALQLLPYGSFCEKGLTCSIFKNKFQTIKNNELNQNHNSNSFDNIKNCRGISITLETDCTFPVYITEKESSISKYILRIDNNGTYSLKCPDGDSFSLNSNLDNCAIDYNLTISKGLIKDSNIKCFNQSETVGGNTYYFCNCSDSGSECS